MDTVPGVAESGCGSWVAEAAVVEEELFLNDEVASRRVAEVPRVELKPLQKTIGRVLRATDAEPPLREVWGVQVDPIEIISIYYAARSAVQPVRTLSITNVPKHLQIRSTQNI